MDRYYIGSTGENLEDRLRKHNSNHKGYTGNANDWNFVYKELFESKSKAYKRELEIKKQKSRNYIERLLKLVE